MTSKVILSLDLSTTCTGFSIFSSETKELLYHGIIKPQVKGVSKLKYPIQQLMKCRSIADQVLHLCIRYGLDQGIDHIVIEEINRHKSRTSGKTLDICHGLLWDRLDELCKIIIYMDSDGATGWRTRLRLFLTDADKARNKESKKLNKNLLKGTKKIPIINKKHLACRYVNDKYDLNFDVDLRSTDADECDSIGLGHAFIHYVLPTLTMV